MRAFFRHIKRHKKAMLAVIIVIIVVMMLCLVSQLYRYCSYADEQLLDIRTTYTADVCHTDSDTISVLLIGDSWAAYHQSHDLQLEKLLQQMTGRSVSVTSKGLVGAKTKAIYEALCDSVGCFLNELQQKADYCIVSAGINDAVAGMGPDNYTHHYTLIIRQLHRMGITPVIIDMPDVDYNKVRQREATLMGLRHRLMSLAMGIPDKDFRPYRNALREQLKAVDNNGSIIYVPHEEWNRQGVFDTRQLYLKDGIHLNSQGYSVLDSCLASHIARSAMH